MTTYLKSWCVVLISLQLGSGFDPHSRLLQKVSGVFFRYHYSFYWSHRSLWRILWRQKTKDNFFGWAIVGSKCLVIKNWYQSHTPKPFGVAKLDSPEKYFFVFIFVHCSLISENTILEHHFNRDPASFQSSLVHSSSNFCWRSEHLASESLIPKTCCQFIQSTKNKMALNGLWRIST